MKKIISGFIAVVMVFGCFVSGALADSNDLIAGGDFENVTFSTDKSWTFPGVGVWHKYGTDCTLITENENTYASFSNEAGLGQRVAVTKGETYILTAKTKNTATNTLCIQNGNEKYPGNIPNNTLTSIEIPSSTEWTTISLEWEAAVSEVVIYVWGNAGLCLDDVSFKRKENMSVSTEFVGSYEGDEKEPTYAVAYKASITNNLADEKSIKASDIKWKFADKELNVTADTTITIAPESSVIYGVIIDGLTKDMAVDSGLNISLN